MNILLFHPEVEALEMIRFCLESEVSLAIHCASTFQQAVDYFMDETPVDLIIAGEHSATDKLFKYLLSTEAKIPVVFLSGTGNAGLEPYPDIQILGQMPIAEISKKLIPLIKSQFDAILNSSVSNEYCRISTSLLVRVVPLRGDIFIRLSSVKYVKLFKQGSKFTQEDLEKYLNRRQISFLYIKKTETHEFVEKFQSDLTAFVEKAVPGDHQLMETVTEVHELIQDLSSRLGFNEEVRNLAKINVKLAMKSIGANPKISRALSNSQLKSKNYISSHSVLIANVACSIAAQMKWPSDTTFQKLVIASLFHDFLLQNPEHAKITSKEELEKLKTSASEDQYNIVKNHPIQCAAAVDQLDELPADVNTIVLQHHERPDGKGFPKGLRSQQIAPLSAVFIVAQDILDKMTVDKGNFDLVSFLKETEALYESGTFKKIWKTLAQQEIEAEKPDSEKKSVA